MFGMIGSMPNRVVSWVGGPSSRRLARYRLLLKQVHSFDKELQDLKDGELRRRSLSLRYRAKCGESLDKLLPEAFALVREAASRTLKMRHYDVQLLGGMAMHDKCIAEMQTGEGKTLTATLPLYLHALSGRGVVVATANDYLAQRDADELRPLYEMLGLKVGTIQTQMSRDQRRENYACDITYGTAKEFGFDFLRDQLLLRGIKRDSSEVLARMLGQSTARHEEPVQREPHFILVDEADSLMIDDARTPLIISAIPGEAEEARVASFRWAAENQEKFSEKEHYTWDHKKRQAELTAAGRMLARVLPKPEKMDTVDFQSIYEYIERAILAGREFFLETHYVVQDGEIVIIDESTGRAAEGRKWRDGLHQAIEAKEDVEITIDAGQAARITVQDFFLRYEILCGMTGTAVTSAGEFSKVYSVQVVVIPTNRPCIRSRSREHVFGSEQAKWEAIVAEIQEMIQAGRSVLVGTRSIDKSERLSKLLQQENIQHQVLNANRIAEEAEIVSQAGQPGKVTVSTNMAGRGTDIKLDDSVREAGGLHVVCTEMHDSGRIDRQLVGRCARQGDPGSYRVFMSLDDDILKNAFGPKRSDKFKRLGEKTRGTADRRIRLFRAAQRKIERRHFRDRKILLYHERERKKMQLQMGQDPYLDTPH
ncbi:Preprotein translocase subunit SecA [Planctomycetales bacterium 10988]|nr:Preprotein translocase subunit SecA [Planctomycetales bacterium 10988]